MNGFACNHCRHRTARRPDRHALADQLLWVPAANGLGVEKTLVINIGNDQADLVAVAGEQHALGSAGVLGNNHIAVNIGRHLVGKAFHIIAHDSLHRLFIARWAWRQQKCFQKFVGLGFHREIAFFV